MKTIDGYLVPEEHLSIIRDKKGTDFNITSITKTETYYEVEGTYANMQGFFTSKVTLSEIIQEIRERKINQLLK